MTRAERATEVARLYKSGVNGVEIAKRLKISRSYVYCLLNDPDGVAQRARKRAYAGRCRACGHATNGSNGKAAAAHYCHRCVGGVRKNISTEGRTSLIAAVREAHAEGKSCPAIAAELDVSVGFVRYHVGGSEYEKAKRRKERERQIDVECAGCGDPATITEGALKKREHRGMGPYTCRSCGQYGKAVVKPITDTSWLRADELLDGETPEEIAHSIRHWAWRALKEMTPKERRGVALITPEALRGDDRSSFARPPKPQRERFRLDPHPYAKLEVPFGARARGEMAA